MHRGLRPGGLYLEGLDAKLHYDCNNGGSGGHRRALNKPHCQS